jgi:nucleotide-binding universal stress UspA family protein
MFSSILVPLDGSPFSEQALPLAEILGRSSETKVHLGHVYARARGDRREEANGGLELDGKDDYLARLVERLKEGGIQADQWLMEGKVAEAIEDWAEEMNADLIVMATHGRAGLERFRLGSVAESLVSRGRTPMLLLHPGEGTAGRSLEKAVVALDGSLFAQTILDPLRSVGVAAGIKSYTLLHVADDKGVGKAGWTPVTTRQSRAEEQLDRLRAQLEGTDAHVEVRVVTASDPSEGILEFAEKEGAGLIAMTTHGMTGLRPTLLGSVAAKVLHSWEGPLLLRRPVEDGVA